MAKVFDMGKNSVPNNFLGKAKSWINDVLYNDPAPVEPKPTAEEKVAAESPMSALAKAWQARIAKAEDDLYGQATGNVDLPSWALPTLNPHPAQGYDPARAARNMTLEEVEESRRRIDEMMQRAMSGPFPASPWDSVGRAAAQAEANPEAFAERTMSGQRVSHAQYEAAIKMRDRAEAIIARYDAENDPAFDGMYAEVSLPENPPSLRFVPGKMLEQINQLSVVHGITSLVVTKKILTAIIDEMNDRSMVWAAGDVPGRSIRMYGVSIEWR